MSIRTAAAVALLALAVHVAPARAATCAVACRDEVATCVGTDCQGLVKRPLRRCKKQCRRSLLQSCYADLSVCGATVARAPKPSGGSGGGMMGGY